MSVLDAIFRRTSIEELSISAAANAEKKMRLGTLGLLSPHALFRLLFNAGVVVL